MEPPPGAQPLLSHGGGGALPFAARVRLSAELCAFRAASCAAGVRADAAPDVARLRVRACVRPPMRVSHVEQRHAAARFRVLAQP
jgi:hypothetical protein